MAIELIVLVNSLFPPVLADATSVFFPLPKYHRPHRVQSFSFLCYADRVVNNMMLFSALDSASLAPMLQEWCNFLLVSWICLDLFAVVAWKQTDCESTRSVARTEKAAVITVRSDRVRIEPAWVPIALKISFNLTVAVSSHYIFVAFCDGGEVLWWLGRCWMPCWRSGAPAIQWSLQSSTAWGEGCRPPASQTLQDFLFNQV